MGRTSDAAERLVVAMAKLAHRRGYADVGVDDVCREAGVKKGSFYHFFPSKRALMLAALQYQQQMLGSMMLQAFDPSCPPLARFAMLAAGMNQMETASLDSEGLVLGCPFGRVAAEVGQAEPELAKAADAAFRAFAALYEGALREAQAAGDIDASVDAAEAAEAMMAYVQGVSLVAKTRNDPAVIARLLPKALQLALPSPSPRATRAPDAKSRAHARRPTRSRRAGMRAR